MNPHPIHKSHPIFDFESEIVKAKNCPAPVDLSAFQEQVDRAVGLTVSGRSRIRIVWGQSFEQTKMLCFERYRLKYPFYRYSEGGEIHDIGIPRFFVEQLHGAAELNHQNAWEQTRYSWIPGIGKVDMLGPVPEEGFYTALFQIALHDHLCCDGKEIVNGESCLGAYREPNDSDLERIRRMYQRREQATEGEMAPSPELIAKRTADALAKRNEKWEADIKDVTEDFFRANAWKFTTDDESALRWGKYHWAGAHSKSGLSQDQLAQARRRLHEQAKESNDNNATSDNAERPTSL